MNIHGQKCLFMPQPGDLLNLIYSPFSANTAGIFTTSFLPGFLLCFR